MKALLATLIAAAVLLHWWFQPEPIKEQIPVTVKHNDTLFDICGELAKKHGDKRNIQEIVYYARKHNGLEGKKYIYAGDKLVIEIEKGR